MAKAKTVLHGVDQSCESQAKLPNAANMASRCMTEDLLASFVFDTAQKAWLPEEYIAFVWRYSDDGGTQGAITLSETVPANTIILDGILDVIDPITSGGSATIKISLEADQDVLATTAIGSLGMGLRDVYPNGSASRGIRTTQERHPVLTVGTAAITGGCIVGFLRCMRGLPLEEQSSSSSSSPSMSTSSDH